MNLKLSFVFTVLFVCAALAQNGNPTDYLSAQFHKERREALRAKMPQNSVAVFFGNPIRNRANDVDFIYHQDPDFYYLTGYKEPNSVLVIFSNNQTNKDGRSFNELLYVQEKNPRAEQWTGVRLGTEGAKKELGFENAFNGAAFLNSGIDYASFDTVFFKEFEEDTRNSKNEKADLYKLIGAFKSQIGYNEKVKSQMDSNVQNEINAKKSITSKKATINTKSILTYMASLREKKSKEELVLLTKAVRISAMGQREIMKAMHPGMSETEIQGIHEFVYKKYGSEFEGYPSIVGAGNNGCVLHYIENSKMKVENDLVLMDLGAEYHGYTADVTRTIPANGKFSTEQKLIYDLVYDAQEAGIAAAKISNNFNAPDAAARKIISAGLVKLGIVKTEQESRKYFPHGTSHHIGLDVHDPGLYNAFEADMVVTVEPGIYIPIGSDCDKKWWGIAVRIEDDILITTNGPVNLSGEAPRKSNEIEALMNEKSVLDTFAVPNLD
ncbi:aminopeptidase P N-terminal domain-containing protein [Flavobacterium sp. XS2P24]|uniref:aminopeptidase P N-terminal domain-containing protein n=1 Tax=Flavobacterium sp. XS2P24 TaxID=3041249 RepID=UPI0024A875B6|nr:aminopeptidase P N-terminal domain-containing protein [Flavobacterium sp. XS2P24]MDI6049030.1 aminopeptidase P N-terminal domain-containing protein [Flavobacterium sp. XS2P24]